MPKAKQSVSNKLKLIVAEHKDVFKTDGSILFCNYCEKSVVVQQKSQLEQHINSAKHKEQARRHDAKLSQSLLMHSIAKPRSSAFKEDLCLAFVAADIPLSKLSNPRLVSFLEKYTNERVPDESTIRKKYVRELFNIQMNKIKEEVQDKYLWVSIDETTDSTGRYIFNVILGILDVEQNIANKKFLLNVAELEKANHSTFAILFDESIKLLGDNFNRDRILLLISDAAPYMVKAAQAINVFYPKIVHVTCLVHDLHRVAETIRFNFSDVNRLISNVKSVFLKAPSRVQIFKSVEPNLELPPQPVITRWGSWLSAVRYYAKNLEKIQNIFKLLREDESIHIKMANELMTQPNIKNDLTFISANYCHLVGTIEALESPNKSLKDQLKMLQDTEFLIENVDGTIGKTISAKLKNVLDKNKGLQTVKTINNILNGNANATDLPNFSASEIASLKYATITSVDVERSFSMYKNFLRPNRQKFKFDNIKHHLIIYCTNTFNNDLDLEL